MEPDFTSQVCPVCSNLNAENRHSKGFCCTSCGYHDDADHVGAVNIRNRAGDKEILELCREHQYSHKNLQNAIRIVYEKRHIAYEEKKQHLHESRRDPVTSYMMLQDLICD